LSNQRVHEYSVHVLRGAAYVTNVFGGDAMITTKALSYAALWVSLGVIVSGGGAPLPPNGISYFVVKPLKP